MSSFSHRPQDTELEFTLRPHWGSGVELTSEFIVSIDSAQSRDEQRRLLSPAPKRVMKVSYMAISQREASTDAAHALQHESERAQAMVRVPLWSDVVRVESVDVNGSVIVYGDFKHRRFFAGLSVGVLSLIEDQVTRYRMDVLVVSEVHDDRLVLDGPDPGVQPGSRVAPLLRCHPSMSDGGVEALTDRLAAVDATFIETYGDEVIPSIVEPGSTVSSLPEHNGMPVMEVPHDWSAPLRASHDVEGTLSNVGHDMVGDLYGGSLFTRRLTFTGLSREDSWNLVSLWESRAGPTFPMWVPTRLDDVRVVAVTTSYIEARVGYPSLVEAQRHIGKHVRLKTRSGAVHVARVIAASLESAGTRVRLTLYGTINTTTFNTTTLRQVSWCYLARFSVNEMVERWETTDVMSSELLVRELRVGDTDDEYDPEPPIINPPDPGDPEPRWVPDPSCAAPSAVTVPTYQVPCVSCDGERPAFRVGDFTAAHNYRLDFDSSRLSKDSSHSHTGALTKAMKALNGKWLLEHDDAWSPATNLSRHWHHGRVLGAHPHSFVVDSVVVDRELWRASRQYVGDDSLPHLLEVRLVAEWAEDGSGGWGVMWHVFVFTTESNPDYEDGEAFNGVTYWRDDPAVWDDGEKNCHPQMMLCGHIPTSMESPCGHARLSLDPSVNASEACNARSPGLPWMNGDLEDAIDNSVFGPTVGGADCAAMTLGGGCPTSMLFPWVTLENMGTGLTALKPDSHGYDTWDGGLTLGAPSPVLIRACDPLQDSVDCCEPHVSSPNDGSLGCINFPDTAAYECCFSTVSSIRVTIKQACIVTVTCYDSMGFATTGEVYVSGFVQRSIDLNLHECSYAEGAGVDNRRVEWRAYEDDPDAVSRDASYDFTSGLHGGTQQYGTWAATTGRAVVNSVEVSGDTRALLLWSSPTYKNVYVRAVIRDPSKPAGLGVRLDGSGDGFFAFTDPTAGKLRLVRSDGGVHTLLAESSLSEMSTDDVLSVSVERGDLTASVAGRGSVSYDSACQYSEGSVGIATSGVDAGQAWDDVIVTDLLPDKVFASVAFDYDIGWSISVPQSMMPGHNGECDDTCEGCDDCSSLVGCCTTTKQLHPLNVSATQSGSPWCTLVPSGEVRGEACVIGEVFVDFATATVIIGSLCKSLDAGCNGFEVWTGITGASS